MVKCKQKEDRKKLKQEVWTVLVDWQEEDARVYLYHTKEDAQASFFKIVDGIKSDIDEEYLNDGEYVTESLNHFWVSNEVVDDECNVILTQKTIE